MKQTNQQPNLQIILDHVSWRQHHTKHRGLSDLYFYFAIFTVLLVVNLTSL